MYCTSFSLSLSLSLSLCVCVCVRVTDANKHWNGLIRDFYKPRVQCYVDQVHIDLGHALFDPESPLNTANLTECAIKAELTFTQGTETK